jgi:hypothetical protein
MQKFIHLSHYDATNTASVWDFFSGTQNKPRYVGGYAKYGSGTYRTQLYMMPSPLTATRDNSASTTTNDFLGASPLDWYNTGAPGDGEWHSMEWYVKLNSAGGVADGKARFWLDGRLVHDQSNVVWVPAGDNPSSWQWNHVWLGGNNANTYTPASEQWYAVDDVVVSTNYSGPPANPVTVTAQVNGENTARISWAAGVNGADYQVDGYRIYYGTDAANLNESITTDNVRVADIPALKSGQTYYFAVTAWNKFGQDSNESESKKSNVASVLIPTVQAVVDTTPPVASISSPTTGSSVNGTVTVNIGASDNLAVSKVELYIDGATYGIIGSAPYALTWNTKGSANGSHSLLAKAYDAAGNVGQSASVTVNVSNDTAAPSVAITSPISGSTASGTVSVSANASDNVAVSKVEFYVNGTLKATSTGAPYSYNWNTLTLASGSYTLSAKAYDAAGNVGQSSVTVIVANDTIAPSVSIASPVAGSTIGGTVPVSASASDNVAVEKVELYLNGALVATSTAAPYGYNWNTTNAANGSYTLSVKAYDAAGNVGQSSVTVNVANDAIAPVVSIASPVAGSIIGGTVTVSANASDNQAVKKVELYLNGALAATSTAAPYSFSWNTANAANGSYTVSAKAYDAAGNIGQAAATVTVFNDAAAPSVSIASPVAGATVKGTVSLNANASDNVAVTKVEFYLDGVLQASSTTAPYAYSWNTSTAANGTHTVSAKAYDQAGNVGQSASVSVNVLNDTVAPVISVSAPTKDYVTSSKLTISASAKDNVAVVKMEAYVDNALVLSTSNSSFSVSTSIVKGVHTVTIKAYDASNNVAVFTKTVNRFF